MAIGDVADVERAPAELDAKYNPESRQRQRIKQIEIGKMTEGYQNYIDQVPKDQRVEGVHIHTPPVSPSVNNFVSKRDFDAMLRTWRRFLHSYDAAEQREEGSDSADGPPQLADDWGPRRSPPSTHACAPTEVLGLPRPDRRSARRPPPTADVPPPPPPPPRIRSPSLGACMPEMAEPSILVCCSDLDQHNVRSAPSRSATVVDRIRSGTAVVLVRTFCDAGGDLWGQLMDGGWAERWTLVQDASGVMYFSVPPPMDPMSCVPQWGAELPWVPPPEAPAPDVMPETVPAPPEPTEQPSCSFPTAPSAAPPRRHRPPQQRVYLSPDFSGTPGSNLDFLAAYL
eukprot:TRINITY_DN3133_c0_g1_i1.p1 TRINITY_DN3133_c0_g1~~TRINITY_DN3133_c0_g1_i1.p1  ORF type:complete len:368 (+),score=138.12 TRINITY_DN3133_c0_g1_i1:82-1104(+)